MPTLKRPGKRPTKYKTVAGAKKAAKRTGGKLTYRRSGY